MPVAKVAGTAVTPPAKWVPGAKAIVLPTAASVLLTDDTAIPLPAAPSIIAVRVITPRAEVALATLKASSIIASLKPTANAVGVVVAAGLVKV